MGKKTDALLIIACLVGGIFSLISGLNYLHSGDKENGLAYLGIGLAFLLADYMTVRSVVTDDKLDKILRQLEELKSEKRKHKNKNSGEGTPLKQSLGARLKHKIANLFRRRPKWKPKQKLDIKDSPYLVAEYHVSKDASYIMLSLVISLGAIVVASFVAFMVYGPTWLKDISVFGIIGIILFLSAFDYFRSKASKIAKVLEIEERLKKYGIETEE